ncbi:MAG: hypothetical protein UW24_C0006G0008 [Parcubacteria group bacterium GW2011_GWA2_44_12]|nr:MAG: hypothetical protein UW24_C0006G0008 [Parcubacteria group bacterium GW2011_GWA2_44_12]
MQKPYKYIILALALLTIPAQSRAYDWESAKQWSGRILIENENRTRAWYVDPDNLERYPFSTPADALWLIRNKGIALKAEDFNKLPGYGANSPSKDGALLNSLAGKIVLESRIQEKAWYVDPNTNSAVYLGVPYMVFTALAHKGVPLPLADILNIKARRTAPFVSQNKPPRRYAKGLYLTATSAANPKMREYILSLIRETELNAVVIDVKDASGFVLYNSTLGIVQEMGTSKSTITNLHAVFQEFQDEGVYVIARVVVFADPLIAQKKPEWAILKKNGGLWKNYDGAPWADPTVRSVWDYNSAIGREAASFGADEINFDFVRFPSDGPVENAEYHNLLTTKADTMRNFFSYLGDELADIPAYISVDMFGLVLDHAKTNEDIGIGQRLSDAQNAVDYIYPMTYPSHYGKGYAGFANPALYPYKILKNSLESAKDPLRQGNARLRVWLQAFSLGAIYDGDKIKQQIQAVEETESAEGWILWNARNYYTKKGLRAN